MHIILPKDVKHILDALRSSNFSSVVVGGCVRDSLLGNTPKDWDIATNALPNEVLRIFKSLGYITLDVGKSFGTIVIVIGSENYEITTFRKESGYSDSRHPDLVEYCSSFEEDSRRRDFTINALAFDGTNILDFHNGLQDLKDGVIRCVGNPYARFQEDSLRILRAIRFASKYNFVIENDNYSCSTKDAMFKYASKLSEFTDNRYTLSRERVSKELLDIVKYSKYFNEVLDEYFDIFKEIIPELNSIRYFSQNNKFHVASIYGHTLLALGYYRGSSVAVKIALLLHDLGKVKTCTIGDDNFNHFYGHSNVSEEIARSICNRLKFTNEFKNKVCTLIKYHDTELPLSIKSTKRLILKVGLDNMDDFYDMKECDIYAHDLRLMTTALMYLGFARGLLLKFKESEQCLSVKDLNFSGKDLIAMGYKPSSLFGKVMQGLLELVIDEEVPNEFEALKYEAENRWLN